MNKDLYDWLKYEWKISNHVKYLYYCGTSYNSVLMFYYIANHSFFQKVNRISILQNFWVYCQTEVIA